MIRDITYLADRKDYQFNKNQISVKFSQEDKKNILNVVCSQMCEGKSLRKICREDDTLPAASTILGWVAEDKLFAEQYTRAVEFRTDFLFEEILEIADDSSNDEITNDLGQVKENKEFVNRSRLRVDARKWALSKMLPKKYGEKIDMTSDGKQIAPTFVVNNNSTAGMIDKLINDNE